MIGKSWFSGRWKGRSGSCVALAWTFLITGSQEMVAQVVPDNTLGAESSVVIPDNIQGIESDRIDGGATREANLFHSFDQFNIGAGRGAYFSNPIGIDNIFSRVTGANRSDILGRLGVLGNANLFLINPQGIVFGSGASLNVQGSFLATTADAVNLGDGGIFSATNPQSPPILAIGVPLGLQYGNNPGNVQVQGSDLQVSLGKTLALVGGNVSLDGGQLQAPAGRIELGGVAGESTVGLSFNGSSIGLIFTPDSVLLSNVFLDNGTLIDVSASGEGNLIVNAQNLNIAGESGLRAGTSWLVSSNSNPGSIEINAIRAINLTESSFIENLVFDGAMGKGGDINITADSLTVNNSAQLRADSFGKGDAGNLNINTRNRVSFDGINSRAGSEITSEAEGQAGTINITTHSLSISGGATLVVNTYGQGNAGNVTIKARDTVSFQGSSTGITSQVVEQALGNGGNITISTGNLFVSDGAILTTSTFGLGDAGNVTIKARDTVSFQGSSTGIASQVFEQGLGNGGNITISTGNLVVSDGAFFASSTFGLGDAGNVTIKARDTVSFQGSSTGIASQVFEQSLGNGGNITISTGNLVVSDGAFFASSTFGLGDAGNVTIKTRNLTARNGTVTTSSQQSAGGSISIAAAKIRLFGDSDITTNVSSGTGGGGNIHLQADSILAFGDSDILASAREGRGGDITFNTPAFFGENYRPALDNTNPNTLDNNNLVDINANGAVSGIIITPDVSFIQNSLLELPENQINTDSILANSCITRRNQRNQQTRGSFTITGTGGLPQRPGDIQMSSFPTVDVETLPSDSTYSNTNPNPAWQKGDPIVEPQGVYRLSNGKLVLSRGCS